MATPNRTANPRKLAVVTGASRGIGAEVVRSLVRDHDCRVIAIARDAPALNALSGELGHDRVETLAIDLGDAGLVPAVVEKVQEREVHALVLNAGQLLKRALGEYRPEEIDRLFRVNVTSYLLLAQELAPCMGRSTLAHMVVIGGMGGFQDSEKFKGLAAYSASKAAVAALAQCLAVELLGRNIHCNCLALGSVDTQMLRDAFPEAQPANTPQEMGAFVARFALEGQNLFNGRILPVSKGTP